MNGVRSRRQASAEKKSHKANGSSNGNGNGHAAVAATPDETYPRENIFLFWPNVIGKSLYSSTVAEELALCSHLNI